MKIFAYSRVLGNQAFSLLRNLNSSGRVSIYASQQRAQHTSVEQAGEQTVHASADQTDEPIDLQNPYKKDKKICILCKYNIHPDYKNVRLLSQFQSRFTGRIYGRHLTGLCKRKQELVEREIAKAQHAGLMPYYHKEVAYATDPKLFDIDNPFKPHKY